MPKVKKARKYRLNGGMNNNSYNDNKQETNDLVDKLTASLEMPIKKELCKSVVRKDVNNNNNSNYNNNSNSNNMVTKDLPKGVLSSRERKKMKKDSFLNKIDSFGQTMKRLEMEKRNRKKNTNKKDIMTSFHSFNEAINDLSNVIGKKKIGEIMDKHKNFNDEKGFNKQLYSKIKTNNAKKNI